MGKRKKLNKWDKNLVLAMIRKGAPIKAITDKFEVSKEELLNFIEANSSNNELKNKQVDSFVKELKGEVKNVAKLTSIVYIPKSTPQSTEQNAARNMDKPECLAEVEKVDQLIKEEIEVKQEYVEITTLMQPEEQPKPERSEAMVRQELNEVNQLIETTLKQYQESTEMLDSYQKQLDDALKQVDFLKEMIDEILKQTAEETSKVDELSKSKATLEEELNKLHKVYLIAPFAGNRIYPDNSITSDESIEGVTLITDIESVPEIENMKYKDHQLLLKKLGMEAIAAEKYYKMLDFIQLVINFKNGNKAYTEKYGTNFEIVFRKVKGRETDMEKLLQYFKCI